MFHADSILRLLIPFLLLTTLCGCSGQDDIPWQDTPVPSAKPSAQPLSRHTPQSERERLIAEEIRYYLERHNPQDEGFDIVVRYAEQGDSTMAVYLPKGRLTLGNMLNRHQGKSLMKDARGRLIVGCFHADTLVSGLRIDTVGFYAGMMNRRGEAWGHGSYRSADGTYYEGHWEHDQREGFGLSIGPDHLKVGTWLRDQFRGERMSYHSDRIYGIDISRYQHEKGRRRFAINWSRLRITGLGRRISSERVYDKVDYPVTFVYIKSTEGTTIQNNYFDTDYVNARTHGLHVGAYHFFSTKTHPDDQARHFLENTRFTPGDLPPMLDIEPSDKQISDIGGPEQLFVHVRQWLRIVEETTHVRPLLYVNQRFVNTYLPLAPDLKNGYHFWIARYGEYKPDIHLDLWQLSADGHVQGIIPEVDINVFNGYQGQWDEFLRTQTIP